MRTVVVLLLLFQPLVLQARPRHQPVSVIEPQPDIVGERLGETRPVAKASIDTLWIADWSFDDGTPCSDSGWERVDHFERNDGRLFWEITDEFAGVGAISGRAAMLGIRDACCAENGYDNDWYQAIRIEYSGSGALLFDYLLDSEENFDFLQVEVDSACASFARVDLEVDPTAGAARFRRVLLSDSGDKVSSVINLPIPNFDTAETHCLYIAFFSDSGVSPCDGELASGLEQALVVDRVVLTGIDSPFIEDFEDVLDPRVSFANIQESEAFGQWSRLFPHATDNDVCTENHTCSWIGTDNTTPLLANDPSMVFGPEGFVMRSWLDNSIVSPWVSLASTPQATGTIIQFRRFPGNFFESSRIHANWSVRGVKRVEDTETQAEGDSVDCISAWGHDTSWQTLDLFGWVTITDDMTADFDPGSSAIQIRHRIQDRQHQGADPPQPLIPGPGPYTDRTRIGRLIVSGPILAPGIDTRSQPQDGFATEINPGIPPDTGEHYRPTADRFGSSAFSAGLDKIADASFNLSPGDSVTVRVTDARDAGGITSVEWYGAIVDGPHQGKAPPPWTVGTHGFFVVPAVQARNAAGQIVADIWFVDLDDAYFRGGDVVHSIWLGTDALGGTSSWPSGLSTAPGSLTEAQEATQGLVETSFLPTIAWDPGYVARVAADPHGKLEPTAQELAGSSQARCLLYYSGVNSNRRSGDVNRTSFMYTLDRLGYRGHYDVFDHQGLGNTNNHLAGRGSVQQAQGYNLIVYDAGRRAPDGTIVPDGSEVEFQKVDQASWFRNWLGQAFLTEVGFATLWIIGANALEERPGALLYTSDMQVTLAAPALGIEVNPDMAGAATFAFDVGGATCSVDFSNDAWTLEGSCRPDPSYDALEAVGTAVPTHRYVDPATGLAEDAGVVMNFHAVENWNTVLQSHPWRDIRDPRDEGPSGFQPETDLLRRILDCVLPLGCRQKPTPSDSPGAGAVALRTWLYANTPNPFNPTTSIRFDLAAAGRVRVRVYDVSGRLVRELVDATYDAGRHQITWDGLDANGRPVASGVYLYRFTSPNYETTRKMIAVK